MLFVQHDPFRLKKQDCTSVNFKQLVAVNIQSTHRDVAAMAFSIQTAQTYSLSFVTTALITKRIVRLLGNQESCPYIKLSLLRGAIAVSMQ